MQYDRQAKTPQIAFIHKIEKPATMKMPIWNAQQMAKKINNRAATKCSNRRLQQPPKAGYTMKTEYNRSGP
jgi:hypothetical protein